MLKNEDFQRDSLFLIGTGAALAASGGSVKLRERKTTTSNKVSHH